MDRPINLRHLGCDSRVDGLWIRSQAESLETALLADDKCPHATIILCLRGSDPFLDRCIHGLRRLDYPNYEVVLVVDSDRDPANEIIDQHLKSDWKNVNRVFLKDRLETCSLKCSSLIHGVEVADPKSEFFAFIDADTVPHQGWLRELASSLQFSDVGAVTGNRWYMPLRDSIGSYVRYVWNAAAVVQMYGTQSRGRDSCHQTFRDCPSQFTRKMEKELM